MLHYDKELFEQVVLRTSEYLQIDAAIIEKDYYVTLLLQEIVKIQPDIIFKGGTSLSKCYRIIDRFSEDIDLTIFLDEKPTESQRKQLKENIVSAIKNQKMELINPDEIRSRREYNCYLVSYPSMFSENYLKPHLQVETTIFFRTYPTMMMPAASYIYDYLTENDYTGFITQYHLEPFEIRVQTADRTLVDKVFALCDYYMSGSVTEHSRHIYDIFRLSEIVFPGRSLKDLAEEVREEREPHKTCLSAAEGVSVNTILREIIDKEAYKEDYKNTTRSLLFTPVSYDTAISALEQLIEANIFE